MIRMKAIGIVISIGAVAFSAALCRALAEQPSIKSITKRGHKKRVPIHTDRAELHVSPYRKQVNDFVRGKRSGLDGYDAVDQGGVQ